MAGVGRLIIILAMASVTGIGCVVVVTIVANGTILGYSGVGSVEGVVIVVYVKSSRAPSGFRGVT